MKKQQNFSEKQQRRWQKLLDKQAEAARKGKELSPEEQAELVRLTVQATMAIKGWEKLVR